MQTRQLERLFKACANARRISILAFLKRHEVATVGEIARHIRLSFKSTSKHLILLRAVELVECEQVSLEMHYRLAPKLYKEARIVLQLL